MDIYASLQTDIPAFYLKWFLKRMEAGYIDTEGSNSNTIIRHHISSQDNVYFFTRNPTEFCKKLKKKIIPLVPNFEITTCIDTYERYYHPRSKGLQVIIPQIQEIGECAKARSCFCYGPVFKNAQVNVLWHVSQFKLLCELTKGSVYKSYISFTHGKGSKLFPCTELSLEEQQYIVDKCRNIAAEFGLQFEVMQTAESVSSYAFDVGIPKACPGGCAYCKYSHSLTTAKTLYSIHDENSSKILGQIPYYPVIIDV